MKDIFFSIIIPVYNAQNYLQSTIDSVLYQSYNNFELLLINDGSTDESCQICKFNNNKDKRVRLVNKNNEGVSIARNTGINMASGQYLFFLDADDLLESDALEKISELIKQKNFFPDIIFANHKRFFDSTNKYNFNFCNYDINVIEKTQGQLLLLYLFENLINFKASIWSHVYRLEFIKQNHIYFDSNLIMSEDIDWMFNVINESRFNTALIESIYFYRIDNFGSTTHQVYNYKKYLSNHLFCKKWFNYFISNSESIFIKSKMLNFLAKFYINYSVFVFNILIKEERIKAIKLFENDEYIITYSSEIKYKFFNMVKKIIGTYLFLFIINKAHNIKIKFKKNR